MKIATCGCSAAPHKAEKNGVCVFEQKERAGNVERLSYSMFAFLRAKKLFIIRYWNYVKETELQTYQWKGCELN